MPLRRVGEKKNASSAFRLGLIYILFYNNNTVICEVINTKITPAERFENLIL